MHESLSHLHTVNVLRKNCLFLRYSKAISGWINRMEGPVLRWTLEPHSSSETKPCDDDDSIVLFPSVLFQHYFINMHEDAQFCISLLQDQMLLSYKRIAISLPLIQGSFLTFMSDFGI